MHIRVGPTKASGTIFLSGNKNSALPVIASSILWPGKVVLYNIPNIVDVQLFLDFLESIGVIVDYNEKDEVLKLDYSKLNSKKNIFIEHPGKLSKIRAVILLLVALTVRFKKVKFGSSFSGCNLGSRPLTVHFNNLKKLGFKVLYTLDKIEISLGKIAEEKNTFIWQQEASVTGTEVALIASTARKGKTVIYNAACEPHVQDTAYFLEKMGYKVKGVGTNLLEIESGNIKTIKNKTISFSIYSDPHEYATWLGISAITGGNVRVVHNIHPCLLTAIDNTFAKFGYIAKHRILTTHDIENYKRASKKAFVHEINSTSSKLAFACNDHDNKMNDHLIKNKEQAFKENLFVSNLAKKRFFKLIPEQNGYIILKPGPWPGLLVDILSLFVPLAGYSNVPVLFHNWMFDGGLFWVLELRKAGVSAIMLDPHRVVVKKDKYNHTATFEAPYIIRATIALMMYGLSMPGGATILNADAAFRGHPWFLEKLQAVGVEVDKLEG